MENATKALLIAAAILIAIVVITLGVFVLGKGSSLVKENSDMSDVEISTYNSKFEGFCGKNIRGAQVRQLINAVNQHNRTNSDDVSRQIELVGDTNTAIGGTAGKPFNNYNASAVKTGYAYEVEEELGDGGLISKITIKQITTP